MHSAALKYYMFAELSTAIGGPYVILSKNYCLQLNFFYVFFKYYHELRSFCIAVKLTCRADDCDQAKNNNLVHFDAKISHLTMESVV